MVAWSGPEEGRGTLFPRRTDDGDVSAPDGGGVATVFSSVEVDGGGGNCLLLRRQYPEMLREWTTVKRTVKYRFGKEFKKGRFLAARFAR